MKRSTTIAIACTLLLIICQHLLRVPYYKSLLSEDLGLGRGVPGVIDLFVIVTTLIVDIIVMIIGAVALGHSAVDQKEKAYAWFRYIFVVLSIFYLLEDLYYFSLSGTYFFNYLLHAIGRLIVFFGQIALVVVLIKTKPNRAVNRVNLQHYDMVVYTTKGHRFVHYLLDFFFIIPVWLTIISMFVNLGSFYLGGERNRVFLELGTQVSLGFSFLLYYFISEAIFHQTFGKMVTRSCVVTNGVEYTNGRMFRRTLSRLIPFDKFSFLFGANWHDKVSATSVVYVDSWEKAFDDKADSEQA